MGQALVIGGPVKRVCEQTEATGWVSGRADVRNLGEGSCVPGLLASRGKLWHADWKAPTVRIPASGEQVHRYSRAVCWASPPSELLAFWGHRPRDCGLYSPCHCRCWERALTSCCLPFDSLHTGLLQGLQPQACPDLPPSAVPSAWNAVPVDASRLASSPPSHLCSDVSPSGRPSLVLLQKMAVLTLVLCAPRGLFTGLTTLFYILLI